MKKIGFIGIGIMGGPIVNHLLDAGYHVFGFSRTKAKVQAQLDNGMVWCETIEAVVTQSDVIFTMVGFPQEVEDIYFGENGIFAFAQSGQYLVDLTTSKPSLAKQIFEQAATKNIDSLDAPVTGGDLGAINGTLAMMVGGSEVAFNELLPIFEQFAKTIRYFGVAGNGQHAKMANQTAIAANLLGMAESITYAKTVGLDVNTLLEIMGSGSASSWQLVNNGAKAQNEDFSPGFFIKHFSKDMKIALAEMAECGCSLEGLALVERMYATLMEAGMGDLGTQAILKK